MDLRDLFKKRLLLVTGKGGVGKSVVAASLGLLARTYGKTVLLMELNESERMAELFHVSKSAGKIQLLTPGVYGLSCSHAQAQEEFAVPLVKIRLLYNTLIKSKILRSFLDATPGLHDLVMLHQLVLLTREEKRQTHPQFDCIILDAPASGHMLSLLRSPELLSNIFRVGPIRKNLKAIHELLFDPTQTALVTVTLLEDLPVTETLEFLTKVKSRYPIELGPIFVNCALSAQDSEEAIQLFDQLINKRWEEIVHWLDASVSEREKQLLMQAFYLYAARRYIQSTHLERIRNTAYSHKIIPFFSTIRDELALIHEIERWLKQTNSVQSDHEQGLYQ